MILAGIDEAGYGPLLGPLVVGCCAFELSRPEDNPDDDVLPCLWKRLTRVVSRNRLRTGRKLHINDSKKVYSPAVGLRELERSILALAVAYHPPCVDLAAFLTLVAPQAADDLSAHPWYDPFDGETFPLEHEPAAVQTFANALRVQGQSTQTHCIHLAARVVPERRLNQMFGATRNKGSTLFSVTAAHLDHLLRNFDDRGLVIVCDRQGGREHYGHLLRQMFDDYSLLVISEQPSRSEYHLTRGTCCVRIIFTEKAEAQCMSVAVASMLSKYLREALMRRFNAYWNRYLPDVPPTAGYHTDGSRFLLAIDTKRRELGIPDELLIRSL